MASSKLTNFFLQNKYVIKAQEETTVDTKREAKGVAKVAYFENFVAEESNLRNTFFGVLPILFDTALYLGTMVYLFSLKTTLVFLITPIAGITVFFVLMVALHILGRDKKIKEE